MTVFYRPVPGQITPINPVTPEATDFIFTWKSDNNGISDPTKLKIPTLVGGAYDFFLYPRIDDDSIVFHITTWNDSNLNYDYGEVYEGDVVCRIGLSGTFDGFAITNGLPSLNQQPKKFMEMKQWGGRLKLGNTEGYHFSGMINMVITATDSPDMSTQTNMDGSFQNCQGFQVSSSSVSNLNSWDWSHVLTSFGTFQGASVGFSNTLSLNASSSASFGRFIPGGYGGDVRLINTSSGQDLEAMLTGWNNLGDYGLNGLISQAATNISRLLENVFSFTYDGDGFWDNDFRNVQFADDIIGSSEAFSTSNYDLFLEALYNQSVINGLQFGVTWGFGQSKYTAFGEAYRALLITNYSLTFNDGGLE